MKNPQIKIDIKTDCFHYVEDLTLKISHENLKILYAIRYLCQALTLEKEESN